MTSALVIPLSTISLACFILASITAPAVSSFGLSKVDGITFGALGFCENGSQCTRGNPTYKVSELTNPTIDWVMGEASRDRTAKLLIVILIAAALTFLVLLFNTMCLVKSVRVSRAFHTVNCLVTILAFAAGAISSIATFLVFYPHVQWPTWLLIPGSFLNLVILPMVLFRAVPQQTPQVVQPNAQQMNTQWVRGPAPPQAIPDDTPLLVPRSKE